MSLSRLRRPSLILLLAGLLAFGLVQPGASAHRASERIPLPDGFQPEGITIRHHHRAFLGSLADGDIYRLNLRTGEGRVISQGPGTPSVGLKMDRRGRLFVSGGPGGDARVVDSRSGEVLASYRFAPAGPDTFINDVVLTRRTAWFTESMKPVLYGVPIGRHGRLADQSEVITLPLSGDWVQQPGFNANGIARTPDRRGLLVVQSSTGSLFRVDPNSGVATKVDLHGATAANGDGLLTKGRRLYVVRNQDNLVAVFRLNRAGTSARLVDTLSSPTFDVPTTVARRGSSLYLPNARFNTPATPQTEYWVTRIHR
jgi:sugar lactone lactonase YvrE